MVTHPVEGPLTSDPSISRLDAEMMVDVVLGVLSATVGACPAAVRATAQSSVVRAAAAWRPPFVPDRFQPATLLARAAQRGALQRAQVAEGVVSRPDLTDPVVGYVDVDEVVRAADIDAVAARLDLEAVVKRPATRASPWANLGEAPSIRSDASGFVRRQKAALSSAASRASRSPAGASATGPPVGRAWAADERKTTPDAVQVPRSRPIAGFAGSRWSSPALRGMVAGPTDPLLEAMIRGDAVAQRLPRTRPWGGFGSPRFRTKGTTVTR
jgi:hypothetical protein